MPQATVEDDRPTGGAKNGFGSAGQGAVRDVVFVREVTPGNNPEVGTARLGAVAQEECYLERHARARVQFQIGVYLTTVLMESMHLYLGFPRWWGRAVGDDGVVDLNVPSKNAPNFRKGSRVVDQVDEQVVAPEDIPHRHALVWPETAFFSNLSINAIGGFFQSVYRGLG